MAIPSSEKQILVTKEQGFPETSDMAISFAILYARILASNEALSCGYSENTLHESINPEYLVFLYARDSNEVSTTILDDFVCCPTCFGVLQKHNVKMEVIMNKSLILLYWKDMIKNYLFYTNRNMD